MKEKKDRLSMGTINLINYVSYNNIAEFYRRYEKELDIAKTTLYKALEGNYMSVSIIDRIEGIVQSLTANNKKISEIYDNKEVIDIRKKLVDLIETFLETQNMQDFAKLKEHFNKYKNAIV
jgi:hypothetical protein